MSCLGVGKTVLTFSLMGNDQDAEEYLSYDRSQGFQEGETRGVHHEEWTVALPEHLPVHSGRLKMLVWDYAGQFIYRATHQCFFTRQAIYLLVFFIYYMRRVDCKRCGILVEEFPGAFGDGTLTPQSTPNERVRKVEGTRFGQTDRSFRPNNRK